ncbi:MAG TPA: methylated-DNA--[protein]-cysteine S-methyltransferase, partial [Kineosporiaceae bacterium]|nr:methylated-DNA--[protein]-cysteine S-methyltransferase [Kineosporiaceae bacterium]
MTIDQLLAATPSDPEQDALDRLHAELARRSEEQGLLDVAYRTLDTPVGTLLLAATPAGLVRVAFAATEDPDAVLAGLATAISPRVLHAPARLDPAARELDEYFARRRDRFDLPVDLQLAHGFRRSVLERLTEVPYARTVSYGELAARTGNPRAVRSVGTACGTNPVPLVVPCHRVVRSDGSPGGYRGGPEVKRRLLDLEAGR